MVSRFSASDIQRQRWLPGARRGISDMGWRENCARLTGPGLSLGISLGDLIGLLSDNRLQVPLRYWSKAAFAGCVSLITTPVRYLEEAVYSRRLAKQSVPPPLFVIGHWRSGT